MHLRAARFTRTMRQWRKQQGFTIIELVVVVAIVAILASVALPVVRFSLRHGKENQLRDRLQHFTLAIDRYQQLRSKNLIKEQVAILQGTYPKTLEELTKPINLIDGKTMVLLRERDLIDPMTGKPDWQTSSSTDDPDRSDTNGDNVYDVHSKSTALALDGRTHYNEW